MLYQLEHRVPRVSADAWVADNATVVGSVQLAAGSSVWFNCVLRGDNDDIVVGEDSNIQDGSVLHTDPGFKLVVGRGCTVGHQVTLHGCTVGDHSLVGIRSVVLNGAVIGRDSIVGAGSLVAEGKVFPDGVLLLGSPAKVARELTPPEVDMLRKVAQVYVKNALRYRSLLRPHTV
ncbi:MAG: gamma carbonic anhydrase family protein [Nevskia sp.]|nr:gamma carbonic anhydrase family protein [Nevskia sp.]